MARACLPFIAPLALLLALGAGPAHAQTQTSRDDACSAGVNCDCANITGAGINTNPWRADCRKCEGRIIADCRERYAKTKNALQSITEAVEKVGYCTTICTARGPHPRPLDPGRRPRPTPSEEQLPEPAKPSRILCGQEQRLHLETMAGIEGTGCVNRDGKRHGLWVLRDTKRGLIIEVYYEGGRQIWRREHKA